MAKKQTDTQYRVIWVKNVICGMMKDGISIVDVITIITNSDNHRRYCNNLKSR